MKHPHHQDYDSRQTDLCERALLTVWPHLGEFHSSLALVGGLAPRYLCRNPEMEARTVDIDLGISIATGERSYWAQRNGKKSSKRARNVIPLPPPDAPGEAERS